MSKLQAEVFTSVIWGTGAGLYAMEKRTGNQKMELAGTILIYTGLSLGVAFGVPVGVAGAVKIGQTVYSSIRNSL
jgi:hypothetical protein